MIITYTLDSFFMCIFMYTLCYTRTTTNEIVYFKITIFSTNITVLSSKLNILSHNPVPICQI